MTSSKTHLDAIFANNDSSRKISSRLSRLADAFAATGNEKVANKLIDIACLVEEAALNVYNSYDAMQRDRFVEAQRGTASILEALVVGIDMGKKENGNG